MSDVRLTDELARLMGWRKAPGRYLGTGRSWVSESRFRPLVDLKDAFRVLDAVTDDYLLLTKPGGVFTVQVRVDGRIGRATGEPKARAISVAVARARGLDVEDADLPTLTTSPVRGHDHGR
jgi:hypothetical protein